MKKTTNSNQINRIRTYACITIMLTVLSVTATFGQGPASFNYQAIVRDETGKVKADEAVSIKATILRDSPTGSSVYAETHNTTTNNMGLVNLEIGSKSSAEFNDIDWSDGPYFMKIEINDVVMGTSQLLNVPYAKYANIANSANSAKTANTATSANTANSAKSAKNADTAKIAIKAININASGINAGTLSTDRYSAYDDLSKENKLNNDESSDLLTRLQADLRYNLKFPFHARNTVSDSYTTSIHKVEFNSAAYNALMYNTTTDRYIAGLDGVYTFSSSVTMSINSGNYARLYLYVNGDPYCLLSSGLGDLNYITLTGSTTIDLKASDYVEIWVDTNDANHSVRGSDTDFLINPTHFSGHMVNLIF